MNDLKLIELYRENTILWDWRLDEYKQSGKKSSVWEKIAEALQTTSDAVQKRMKSLRTAYLKWKKLDRHFKQLSDVNSSVRRPKIYKYAIELAFLDPVMVSMASPPTPDTSQLSGDTRDAGELFEVASVGSETEMSQSDDEETNLASKYVPDVASKKRKANAAATDGEPTATRRISQSVSRSAADGRSRRETERVVKSQTDDEHWTFALLIYNMMRDMKPGPACDLCRIKIQQTIMEYKYPVQLPHHAASSSATHGASHTVSFFRPSLPTMLPFANRSGMTPHPENPRWVSTSGQQLSVDPLEPVAVVPPRSASPVVVRKMDKSSESDSDDAWP